jgi:hypothetical protein
MKKKLTEKALPERSANKRKSLFCFHFALKAEGESNAMMIMAWKIMLHNASEGRGSRFLFLSRLAARQ